MRSAMSVLTAVLAALAVLAGVRFQIQMAQSATHTDAPRIALVAEGRAAPDAAVPLASAADASLPLPRQTLVGRLLVLDVVDPVAPRLLARTEPRVGVSKARALAGGYFYSVDVEGNLAVREVDELAEPVSLDYGTYLAVVDHYAYEVAGLAGLRIVDLTAPAATMEVGYYKMSGEAQAVVARGGYAYVAVLDGTATPGYD